MNKRLISLIAAAVLGVLTLSGCQSTTAGGATGQDRKQLLTKPEAEVNRESAIAYNDMLAQARAARVLNTNRSYNNRVNTISKRLINQVGVFRPDAKNWKWEVNVFTTNDVNAFCMAGGKIGVFTGIIDQLQLTDDELAAIIGHEIAHALREHTREKMSQAEATQTGLSLVSGLAGLSGNQSKLADQVVKAAMTMPFSRQMESEADIMGLELMARAGYNPNAAPEVWRKMKAIEDKMGGSSTSGSALVGGMLSAVAGSGSKEEIAAKMLNLGNIMSTHPSSDSRIQTLQADVPKVMPLYEEAKGKGKSTGKAINVKSRKKKS